MLFARVWIASVMLVCGFVAVAWAGEMGSGVATTESVNVSVSIDASQVLREFSPKRLGGTNIAAWTAREAYASAAVQQRIRDLWAAQIRLPGGSWSNCIYWNGHGVRGKDGQVDPSRMGADGYPAVDYGDYEPSFLVDSDTLKPSASGWHGNIDVKGLHEFIKGVGSTPFPCPNLGTGRPVDAAEWVRWANQKMGYDARYWELGNELGGGWEAGTMLPHGKGRLTGDMYGQRYLAMAKAMKAVDPTIKIGGGAFVQEMLRDGGDSVDFVMSHLYPGNPSYDDQRQFGRVKAVSESAAELRGYIQKYQPQRAGKIELAITEWGLPDYRGGREMINGLWSSLFLREAAVSGFDFATQWEWESMFEFARKANGRDADWDAPNFPHPHYWAIWMWNHYTQNRVVKSEQSGSALVQAFATSSDEGVSVQIVNTDREHDAAVELQLKGFAPAARGEMAIFSSHEHFWDFLTQKTLWSHSPTVTPIDVGATTSVTVPPFSVVYVRIPAATSTQPALWAQWSEKPSAASDDGQLRLLLPSEGYAGDRIEGWVLGVSKAGGTPLSLPDAQLGVTGGKADRQSVRLKESAGRFFVMADGPGQVTVSAALGGQTVSSQVTVKPSVPQPKICWFFQEPELRDGYFSDYTATTDDSIRPNQRVARINLAARKSDKGGTLLRMDRYPQDGTLNKANIRGVVFDLAVSDDFACDDPNAQIGVVMQSPANYWMVLGSLKLADAKKWQTYKLMTDDPKLIDAMPFAFNLQFQLWANKPARGSVFLDRAGFMVR